MPEKAQKAAVKKSTRKSLKTAGYLPEIYKGFIQRYPEVIKAVDSVAEICQNAGPLDKKTSELIKLGVAIGLNSEGSIRSHARRAIAEGISADEVRHVVLLAVATAGFPHTVAAYKWVEEVLGKTESSLED